jgi:DHA1 family bicyclomycin/chloramphenicol resistance-like MFS transporter
MTISNSFSYSLVVAVIILSISTVILGALVYIPSLPMVSVALHADEAALQKTVSIYYLGLSVSGLLYGPLSDTFGRKKMILSGLSIFVLGSLFASQTSSLNQIFYARLLQGLGGGAGTVIALAIIKDLFKAEDSIRVLSTSAMTVALSPLLAPIIGSNLTYYLGWQSTFYFSSIFGFITLLGYLFFIKETLEKEKRHPLSFKQTLHNYKQVLTSKVFLGYSFFSSTCMAGLLLFATVSSFVFIQEMGVPLKSFGYYTGVLASFYILSNFLNRRLIRFLPVNQVIKRGIGIYCGGVIAVILTCFFHNTPLAICSAMAVCELGRGLIMANSISTGVGLFPTHKGAASAVSRSIDSAISAFALAFASYIHITSLKAVAFIFLINSCLMIIIFTAIHDKDSPE